MRSRNITLSFLFVLAAMAFSPASARAEAVTGSGFRTTMLAAHNAERHRWRVPALVWNDRLARDAQAHARHLASLGYLRHASTAGMSAPQGENLWMGTKGAFSAQQMMDGFLGERDDYVAGAVPYISRTGNWADTGHYSQIIWRTTTAVGCAIASSSDFDFLVCRYDPAGNIWGKSAHDGDRREPELAMRTSETRP